MSELTDVTARARNAFAIARKIPDRVRATWLDELAAALELSGDRLVTIADQETHLGVPRLSGEVLRTAGQLRLFAAAVREGSYTEATIDHADLTRTPPTPDLRRMLRPLGPVAVFSASNFPFAFSVLGGDTAAALAAGCSVIVKAHPAHPLLSRAVTEVATDALAAAGAPAGLLQLVEGEETGRRLVVAREVRAVAFTGSTAGGRALFDLAASRADPIPFYGELGSVNPVVVTHGAAERRHEDIVRGLVGSFTLGAGQFCTKPGVVLIPSGSAIPHRLAEAALKVQRARMLTPRIADAFDGGVRVLAAHPAVDVLVDGSVDDGVASPSVFLTDARTASKEPHLLLEEVFGPATVLIEYDNEAQLRAVLEAVPGSLTSSLFAEADEELGFVAILEELSGRVIFDEWPTGVAVVWGQQHGGPYPATTSIHTSVGVTSVRRFLRPVAWQNAPERLIPAALREDNPLRIPRRIDGKVILP